MRKPDLRLAQFPIDSGSACDRRPFPVGVLRKRSRAIKPITLPCISGKR